MRSLIWGRSDGGGRGLYRATLPPVTTHSLGGANLNSLARQFAISLRNLAAQRPRPLATRRRAEAPRYYKIGVVSQPQHTLQTHYCRFKRPGTPSQRGGPRVEIPPCFRTCLRTFLEVSRIGRVAVGRYQFHILACTSMARLASRALFEHGCN